MAFACCVTGWPRAMAVDKAEAKKRGATPTKASRSEPIVAIERRVFDSEAFADLRPNSVLLLMVLARQLTKPNNNGHLQATFSYASRYGIGSEHTLRDCITDLIAHGFIYKTRSHGANGAWAKYAVTWLSITEKNGLFLAGFQMFAWRDWKPAEIKPTRNNCSINPAVSAVSAPNIRQKVQGVIRQ